MTELQQALQSSPSVPSTSKLLVAVPSQASGTESHAILESVPTKKVVETSEICTQTTETAFMLCAHCSTIQSALVNTASQVTGLCGAHSLRSRFAIYDWEALVKKGGIDIVTWSDSLRVDMVALEDEANSLIGKVEGLTSERDKLKKQVALLKEKNQSLDIHINALKVRPMVLWNPCPV